MLVLFELGVLLVFLPWARLWEANYFLSHCEGLRPYLLHPAVRGFITGLGALDIVIAAGMLRRRHQVAASPNG